MYSIFCSLVGRSGTVKENMTYEEICDWLVKNEHRLFGIHICQLSNFWSAEYFMRYETKLPIKNSTF